MNILFGIFTVDFRQVSAWWNIFLQLANKIVDFQSFILTHNSSQKPTLWLKGTEFVQNY